MDCKLPNKCWCNACRKLYDANRFLKNKVQRYQHVYKRRIELTEWIREKKSKPCMDCGKKFHPCAMQFDHTKSDKRKNVSDMVKLGFGKRTIQVEIDKCELVCANCHAVRTFTRRPIPTW